MSPRSKPPLLLHPTGRSIRASSAGKSPSSRPVSATTGHSSPLAVCSVIRVTPCSLPCTRSSAESSAASVRNRSSGVPALPRVRHAPRPTPPRPQSAPARSPSRSTPSGSFVRESGSYSWPRSPASSTVGRDRLAPLARAARDQLRERLNASRTLGRSSAIRSALPAAPSSGLPHWSRPRQHVDDCLADPAPRDADRAGTPRRPPDWRSAADRRADPSPRAARRS